jgi:hypothetical protein
MANQYTVNRSCMCCSTKKNTIRIKVGGWKGKYLCGNCLEASHLGNILKQGLDAEMYLCDYFKRKGIRLDTRKGK